MNTSVAWLNQYLTPGASGLHAVSPQEADDVLTHAGFPIEESETLPDGDTFLDVEITSNRGDCISHVGLAREIAASTGRTLTLPEWTEPSREGAVADFLTLDNQTPEVCPRFTAQVVRGCKVGPSPDWLVKRLEAVGQRSINNVVDVTNFITLELGHPCHVFDLKKLAGGALVIRYANEGEKLKTLDGKDHTLTGDMLVVADAEKATSLAGVIGGAESEVGLDTTDIVLEMATWDPVTVRTSSRHIATRTDASYRFERWVSAAEISFAAARAVALIAELTGGTPCEGLLDSGPGQPANKPTTLRPDRCRRIIGIDITDDEMIKILRSHEVGVEHREGVLICTPPPFRHELGREIDLIEEICRTHGFDQIPLAQRLAIRVHAPQDVERAQREVGGLLTGQGFYETVTFSFVTPALAELFMPAGLRAIAVDDDRRKAEPTLRPSAIPSLLICRKANQDGGVTVEGGVRLFETSAVFAETESGESIENRNLALLMDIEIKGKKPTPDDLQLGVRKMRGVIETLVRATSGADADLRFEPGPAPMPAMDTSATITLGGEPLGYSALLSGDVLKRVDLGVPIVAAELNIDRLLDGFPPKALVHTLPEFPVIERDVSLIVADDTRWSAIVSMVDSLGLERLEGTAFVGTFRGDRIGAGKKSVTLRLRFQDDSRTLRHDEVDPEVARVLSAAADTFGAEVRA